MKERGIGVAVVITIVIVIVAVGVGGYFLLRGKATEPGGGSANPLSAYALNAGDMPWLENMVENEVSGVIENKFSASQLSEWGENGLYEKGIYQSNPNFRPYPSGWGFDPSWPPRGSVAYQLIIRFKDVDGAIECYEFAEPLFENIFARGLLIARGIIDITPELLSGAISDVVSENLTFVSAGDRGFIISVRDNSSITDEGVFLVWLQHSNLVIGLIIAKNSYIDYSQPGDLVPGITKDNALAIAQTVYNKMIS